MNEWARAIRLAGDVVRHTLNALRLFSCRTRITVFFLHRQICAQGRCSMLGEKKVTEGRGFTSRELERSLRYFSRGPKKTETLRFLFPSLSIARQALFALHW